MAQVTSFVFEDQPVRSIQRDGEPWFVAADVCAVLDVQQPIRAIERLDEDERSKVSLTNISSNGVKQEREFIIVSESGLYTLILRSRKATTHGTIQHRFRRWVTSEVLPAIRKTGRYEAGNENHPASMAHQEHRYTVREVIVRPDGQWGRVWAIPIYRIDGFDYWNVPLVLDAYHGPRRLPERVNFSEYARDLMELHPELVGATPLWVARHERLKFIVQSVCGCWDVRARRFLEQLAQLENGECRTRMVARSS
ncbi:BRO family protein [Telmatospirillum sp. J64-1]|uniref:BRO-N domain-containing protein n=1 Tax=Telmatospirillum sp. J64-1 TaxID=2502183 RepID=UPI00115CBEEE|nr:BRO family protein [Telmatospirillum sp. J64-1]